MHVVYDRRVTRLPFAAAVDSPVQWVFDRTGPSGLRDGQYLAVSLSAADDYADVPAAALREQFLPALAELFPAAAQARVVDCFVTRERRATMRQVPGVRAAAARGRDRHRGPGPRGRLDRHRVAGHDGGSRAERTERGEGTAADPGRCGAAPATGPDNRARFPGGQHWSAGMTPVQPGATGVPA